MLYFIFWRRSLF